jgi:phosphohistidine phosphatase SixA
MDILLIRHSHAEERHLWNGEGKSDLLRPLSKKGIGRFAQSLKAFDRFIPELHHIYTSQLTRSVQTAEILHGYYKKSELHIIPELNPGVRSQKEDLIGIIKSHHEDSVLAFVGHQPELSEFCGKLLSCAPETRFRFKKGGVALISYMGDVGQLQWLLSQRQLTYMT